jgi:hypothetical protein
MLASVSASVIASVLARCCDNFPYGFKGAPSARQRGPSPRNVIESWRREVPERMRGGVRA